jgi:hypothetical protein
MSAPPELSNAPPSDRRSRILRALVSLWLIYHFAAVVVAPASVSPSSNLIQSSWEWFRPYLQVLYLNHGYHYFAPEPGQSTLLAYQVERQDGTTFSARIPDRAIVPRLLYHRHFMLTEFLGFVSPDLQPLWLQSYAGHLLHKHEAARVSLTQVTHYLPVMEIIHEGATLDEPESYYEESLGSYTVDDFK